MFKSFVISVLLGSLLGACSAAEKVSDVNQPLTAINAAIEKELSMGIQGTSENRREFYSKPFLVKQSDEAQLDGFRERGLAKVYVLGDRRPYIIEVEVYIERAKVPKKGSEKDLEYSFYRHDKGLAKKLLRNILNTLERRENKNFIDDFRPF
jgi:hypothetical protein